MRRKRPKSKSFTARIYIAVTLLALTASLLTATYAWFTSNTRTATELLKARTGTDELELQISNDGSNFKAEDQIPILQINQTDLKKLMPVSTADLKTFVYNPVTTGDVAQTFSKVEKEEYYYHGRVYLKAVSNGPQQEGKMKLYLDQGSESGGSIAQKTSGEMLNAARLGLSFDDGNAGSVIFKLSDESNRTGKQVRNTKVNGVLLRDDQVLDWTGSTVRATADPGKNLADYTIQIEESSVKFPENYLCELELNRSYSVDVYFYLEGCDPDCSDSISLQESEIHLAFYGVMSQE